MTNELRTKYPLDTFSRVEQDEIIRLIESEISLALQEKVFEVEKLKPILWNDDPMRHVENIARHNTIDEVIKILKQ
jgi:hypothetical protein